MSKSMTKILAAVTATLMISVASAEPDKSGVIRNVDHAAKVVTIDEMTYRSSPNLQIRNFAGGVDSFDSVKEKMRARYSVDEYRQLTELWLYSRNRHSIPGIENSIGDNNH